MQMKIVIIMTLQMIIPMIMMVMAKGVGDVEPS